MKIDFCTLFEELKKESNHLFWAGPTGLFLFLSLDASSHLYSMIVRPSVGWSIHNLFSYAKNGQSSYENHRGNPTLTLLYVLNVLNMLNVLKIHKNPSLACWALLNACLHLHKRM